jgi:hypothetical protein
MSVKTARLVLAGSLITAVLCVLYGLRFGALDSATQLWYLLTVGGVLITSYASYENEEQTRGLVREYILVFTLVSVIASLFAVGYDYGAHRAWNMFPLFAFTIAAFVAWVLRRVTRNFKLSIRRDCVNMIRGRCPTND